MSLPVVDILEKQLRDVSNAATALRIAVDTDNPKGYTTELTPEELKRLTVRLSAQLTTLAASALSMAMLDIKDEAGCKLYFEVFEAVVLRKIKSVHEDGPAMPITCTGR